MTPVFGHGALRLYLLSLLAQAPRHGYELMQALEHRFGGSYSPSAGTIYPRLAKLEEEGLLTKSADGRKTTYEITDAGRAELAAREDELRGLESEINDSVRRMASDVRAGVRSAMQALRADLAAAEREARSAPSPPRPPSAPHRPDASTHGGDASGPVPHPSPRPEPERPHSSSDASHAAVQAAARLVVHDIDLALTDFRQQVREAARAERGERMSTATAASVRRELEAALLRIKGVLGS